MPDESPLHYLTRQGTAKLAYRRRTGDDGAPSLMWLSGFKSDMSGTKATALDTYAQARGFSYLRFDYRGHGASEGAFETCVVSDWLADTLAILDETTEGPQILIGSSMGGWLALHAAMARPGRVAALVLIAPAPDFTARLMWPRLEQEARMQIERGETLYLPDKYEGGPTPITPALIADGAKLSLLDAPIPFHGPVRILQGMEDPDVPWTHALDTVRALSSLDVVVTLIKDGDHRLSRDADITRLFQAIDDLTAEL